MVSQLSESTALFSTDVSTDCLAQRLDDYRAVIASPPVDIVDPTTLNHQELAKLRERVAVANLHTTAVLKPLTTLPYLRCAVKSA